ncbi:unnamed protein product [Bemisia tabaci]|uniref:Cytochrome P450 n=1 Tax=Bemisia tabaci TaxID=7038 RepID=A0A9P0F2I1_BEMTA|nr:unnamed protein product [Bemisia tabaci]
MGPFTISLILISITAVLLVWRYLQNNFTYWRKRGVPYVPFWESFLLSSTAMKKINIFEFFEVFYKALDGHRFGGAFQLVYPIIIIRDPELIKTVFIKAFSNFYDRNPPQDEKGDVFNRTQIFQLTGEKWRTVRHKLSPAFSSAKLKIMYQTLSGCAEDLNAHLQTLCSETGQTEIDVKELMSDYTMDVIGAIALGIKCNSIKGENSEFKQIVRATFKFDQRRTIFATLEVIHPKLPRLLGLTSQLPEEEEYLLGITREAIEMRTDSESSSRRDFLQMLMNLRSQELQQRNENPSGEPDEPVFSEDILVGAIGSFLSAGLEPVAATLTFCLYELALHPDIQEKIYLEIKETKGQTLNDISYEDLKKLRYTEQVMNETLRKYPVAGIMARICTEPFKIPDSDVVVEKGMRVFVPLFSIQRDPQYFPEPDRFDPERFSEENIQKIVPGTYLPFGDGPRSCIAMRLALLDVKTMLIKMVSNYTLYPCARTQRILEFDKKLVSLNPASSLWIGVRKR